MDWYFPLLIALPIFLSRNTSGSSGNSAISSTYNFSDVTKVANVPFAIGASILKWPLITKNPRGFEVPYKKKDGKYIGNASRSFGVPRSDGVRKHAAIDLYSYGNDVVVAMESGKVVGIQGFLGPTKAMLIEGNSGIVILYGEIKDGSWKEFDLKKGSSVKIGQPIARVGINDVGTSMLHIETYTKGTTRNTQWEGSPPPNLLNPTKYLLQAVKVT